ncbi:amidase [Flavivirga algicola]|uniref:Amidase n=1 Tax=Flavivirga algicola TaxID=2729136 RepID=A0ABX1RZZ8_9FLAO|nr:amidase [Flavivirga algicola]NMH88671.1 amidase [Flavivirga algicola]
MKSIVFKSATEITKLIRDRKVSCVEVVKQFLDHIEKYNKTIHAVTDIKDYNDIVLEAKTKDVLLSNGKVLGPLHGLPITVKDTFNVMGLVTSNGSPKLKRNIAVSDAELIKRLKNAGAIIIGKTNLALHALDWQLINSRFGHTNNPYNLNCVVGGSSGGSAAAIASGFTALELGTDSGGSIRVPAHFCGVCGIRTTESALSSKDSMETPNMPQLGRHLTSHGPLARNVGDLILAMEVLWENDQQFLDNPPIDFKQFKYEEGKLKIAYAPTLDGLYLDEAYNEVYMSFLDKVRRSRHELVQSQPSYSSNTLIDLWGRMTGFDLGIIKNEMLLRGLTSYLSIKFKYKDTQWARGVRQGVKSSCKDYVEALHLKEAISESFTRFFCKYDVWLTPVAMVPAFKHQKTGEPFKIDGRKVPYTKAFIPFNFPSAIPGHPIVVIPIGTTKEGLPVGIQIHGRKWHDYKLLQIAKELEMLTNGFKIPEMFKP